MRGMIKWAPFNNLIKASDIKEIEKNLKKQEKPTIMEDLIYEIDNILNLAIEKELTINIKYWHLNTLANINGKISKYNKIEKYILINNTRIYFKNIINAYL